MSLMRKLALVLMAVGSAWAAEPTRSAAEPAWLAEFNYSALTTPFNSYPVRSVVPFTDPTALPTYLQGTALFEATPVPNSTVGIPAPATRAWGCLVNIPGTNRLVSAANGGHNDSSDNGVYEVDVGVNAPTGWTTKIAASTTIVANVSYLPDGKPCSRHGYQHAHYIPQRNRILLVGARGWYSDGAGSGDGQVDGLNVGTSTYTWDAGGTYPRIGGSFDQRGFGIACDPLTGNVWTAAGWLWDQVTNTWSQPGTYTGGLRWGWQWDSLRTRFTGFQWRDGQGYDAPGFKAQIMDRTTGAATNITWATDSETVAALAEIAANDPGFGSNPMPAYEATCYDSARDRFCIYYGHMTDSTLANRMYEATPQAGANGWTLARRTLTGMPFTQIAGINGLWRYMPLLQGIYAHPSATAGGFLIRTSPMLVDTDGDGMPDAWELQFGLNPNSGADAAGDSDLDGASNLAEFLAGTDPTIAAPAPPAGGGSGGGASGGGGGAGCGATGLEWVLVGILAAAWRLFRRSQAG